MSSFYSFVWVSAHKAHRVSRSLQLMEDLLWSEPLYSANGTIETAEGARANNIEAQCDRDWRHWQLLYMHKIVGWKKLRKHNLGDYSPNLYSSDLYTLVSQV